MKREDLTALGVTDEAAVQKIMDLHGSDLTKLQNSISTLTADRDGLKTQLGEASGKLAGYDPEWKTKADTAQQEADKKIAAMQFDYALSDALKGANARDVVGVKAHLDLNGLKQNGAEIVGLNDQLSKIKESYGYLFDDGKPAPKFSDRTPGPQTGTLTDNEKANAALREAFGRKGE